MSTQDPTQIVRLSPAVYKALEAKFRILVPNEATGQLQAGYSLGVQAVLRELREGFVVAA